MGKKKKIRDEIDQLTLDMLRKAAQPDPRLEARLADAEAIRQWHMGGAAGGSYKDVYQNKGLAPYLAVYQTAMTNRDADRAGMGVRGKIFGGGSGGDSGMVNNLRMEKDFRTRMLAAGGLENALSKQYADAMGTLGQGQGDELARDQFAFSGLRNYSDYMNKRIQSSGWAGFGRGLLKYGLPIAQSALSAAFTGGMGGLPEKGGPMSGLPGGLSATYGMLH